MLLRWAYHIILVWLRLSMPTGCIARVKHVHIQSFWSFLKHILWVRIRQYLIYCYHCASHHVVIKSNIFLRTYTHTTLRTTVLYTKYIRAPPILVGANKNPFVMKYRHYGPCKTLELITTLVIRENPLYPRQTKTKYSVRQ